jgi:hypothetical protein
VNNPCKGPRATESFTKFTTAAKDDPYVDPGSFNKSLRSQSAKPRERPQTATKPWKNSHPSARKVKNSEFEYFEGKDPAGHPALKAFCKRPMGFYNKKGCDPFTSANDLGYSEDPYERKED